MKLISKIRIVFIAAVLSSFFVHSETVCVVVSDPTRNNKGCVPCETGDCCRNAFSMVNCITTGVIVPIE